MDHFYDLHPDSYPFTLWAVDDDTGELLWSIYVTSPGAINIPGKPEGVRQVNVIVTTEKNKVVMTSR